MELRDIFRMEMYKNRNNKPYLLVIAILITMAAAATFLGVAMIEGHIDSGGSLLPVLIMLVIFFVLGLAVFSLLYPFHLLNVDYKNKVMSLIFASGVSREKYYFVKIGATILTCLIAMFAILLIPTVTFLLVYTEELVGVVQLVFSEFAVMNILPFLLFFVFSSLASLITLTTSVIITKGKAAGIFLFFGFSFIISSLQSSASMPALMSNLEADIFNLNSYMYTSSLFAIIQGVIFALIGLHVLRKQDL